MKYILDRFEPRALFRFFEEISAIPRPSLLEAGIADYLEAFAASRGLWCYRDATHNVLIKKPATKGRENEPAVLLQAHTDMVTEKHSYVKHDFNTEGLALVVRDNRISADGTTLGADDGFGVAIMLAVLDEKEISHPPIECLFTSAEEIGLVGAGQFDYSHITAKNMLNLDSAEENTVIVGCCGGVRSELALPISLAPVNEEGLSVAIGGLCGGHSGEDIHRGRLNALGLMGKLLTALRRQTPFRLACVTGGEKTNAIPRECEAVLLVDDKAAAELLLPKLEALARSYIVAQEDRELSVKIEQIPVSEAMSHTDTDKIIRVLSISGGVLHMRKEPPVMPEASRNLANCRTHKDKVTFGISSRSAKEYRLDESRAEQNALAADIGATVTYYNAYPGWESAMEAPLVRAWQEAYHTVTGGSTEPTLIHAGLETGLITNAVKGLSAIAVGCNIHDLHTPFETMEIASFSRIFRTVKEFLRILN